MLDWRKRQSIQAKVRDTIKDVLDVGLPRAYSPELYEQKCEWKLPDDARHPSAQTVSGASFPQKDVRRPLRQICFSFRSRPRTDHGK